MNEQQLTLGTPGRATARSCVINLMNTVLGAGLLSIPYAIKCDGVLLGSLFVLLSALTSAFGLYLLAVSATYAIPGHASFFSLSKLTVPQLGIVFDLAIAVKCFGVACSYLIVIGDLMPQIMSSLLSNSFLESHPYAIDRKLWITIFLLAILPLVYKRHLDSLKTASLVALSSVGYLTILVVVHFVHLMFGGHEAVPKGPIHLVNPDSVVLMLSSFPILVFGFTCHQNQFTVINELNDRSASTINRIIVSAIGAAFVLYMTVGLTGYLTFGDNVVGNIIVMYPDSITSTIGRMSIVILVALSYPLQANPARASINHVAYFLNDTHLAKSIRSFSRSTTTSSYSTTAAERHSLIVSPGSTNKNAIADESMTYENETAEHSVELTNKKLIIITTIIVVLSYVVSLTITSLEHVLAFVGSTGSTSISFILPGFFAFKLISSNNEPLSRKDKLIKWGALLLIIWGFVVMFVCLGATIFLGAKH
ncbi:hypothetical protein CANARDRAFT_192817 [[Candida] arabinofermentans NRRL YB-2248]|uniref:Amino acid transporter transmembrane domain-containing protein n=1 Tax=[Candida] arabinofermentans NRRL YB-2248 TaxID=983967 RepID=A0A1E4T800_9ASCO|nr:hypothetical protein CANARDRAFT_192817 [[Candida] arabinofermentans NRRL YB-2248]